ncbi:hypothetical protein H072_10734 [Dactylellina haptotyla CBS 200.50]|uniref:Uncharacterized protein n=1 Tax=Dactylellina haptotyla (strain CBS 200.50) TaxID=1284197 RepID=S8B9X3_DACHA|nr:hypothetical protein H072_10734 [Dactylellina haptotyla CBS 200.50]
MISNVSKPPTRTSITPSENHEASHAETTTIPLPTYASSFTIPAPRPVEKRDPFFGFHFRFYLPSLPKYMPPIKYAPYSGYYKRQISKGGQGMGDQQQRQQQGQGDGDVVTSVTSGAVSSSTVASGTAGTITTVVKIIHTSTRVTQTAKYTNSTLSASRTITITTQTSKPTISSIHPPSNISASQSIFKSGRREDKLAVTKVPDETEPVVSQSKTDFKFPSLSDIRAPFTRTPFARIPATTASPPPSSPTTTEIRPDTTFKTSVSTSSTLSSTPTPTETEIKPPKRPPEKECLRCREYSPGHPFYHKRSSVSSRGGIHTSFQARVYEAAGNIRRWLGVRIPWLPVSFHRHGYKNQEKGLTGKIIGYIREKRRSIDYKKEKGVPGIQGKRIPRRIEKRWTG